MLGSLLINPPILAQQTTTREIPLLYSSNDEYTGVLRFINHGKERADISIVGIDDTGTESGPLSLSIGIQQNLLVYADELESGTEEIEDGLGRGTGSWRILVSGPRDIEITAYAEAQDGLLTSLQETIQGENGCWRVPIYYSADNLTQSRLRISNLTTEEATVKISGRDDTGKITSEPIVLTLASNESQFLSAEQLEDGDASFEGALGNGRGNWQLAVESDRRLSVMNLLESERRVSNLSSRPSYAIGHCWLGKTLATADRSIGSRVQHIVRKDGLAGTLPQSPAVYAAIIDETGVRAITALGVKSVNTDIPASIHDKIYLSSATKPMTALMIAALVHEESSKFENGWETTIASVFSDSTDSIHSDFHTTTIKQLLIHESGVQQDVAEWEEDGEESDITSQRLSASLATLAIGRKSIPGDIHYSHAAYMVAGAVAEKLTGQSYEELMRMYVFGPLGMSTAGFGLPNSNDENQPSGHQIVQSPNLAWKTSDSDHHAVLNPSGGVHLSMEDWGKFLQLWMNGKEPTILGRELIQELIYLAARDGALRQLSSGGTNSGGWWFYPRVFGHGEALNHPGSNGNWYTMVWIMRETSRAYLVSTNSSLPGRQTLDDILTPAITRLATSTARSVPPVSESTAQN